MAENKDPSLSSLSTSRFPYTDFKLVSTSRKRQKGRFNPTTTSSHVISLGGKLVEGEWFTKCLNQLKDAWGRSQASVTGVSSEGSLNHVRVLCLGLGSPCASKDARIQLAFLVEVSKCLGIAQGAISVFDPIFTRDDITLLEQLALKVLDQSQASAYMLTNPTILFMPHCDLELYESILSVNQSTENLSRLFLIGNSLQSYLDNRPRTKLQLIAPCILKFTPRLTEIPLPACNSWPTAFNNTSIQFFNVAAEKMDSDTDMREGDHNQLRRS